ncbi:hypothetical protein PG993_001218 [Apiospora rasikravindrae]|uniref:Uncharacterized protein n=1 Tax=Apiospora rasikravindrae TaxID=990691 RepID=A0ABR1UAR7_9PEZI
MQNILAVILLAIAALEGVIAAPLADAAALDVRANEVPQDTPVFDGAADIYERDLADDDEKQNHSVGGGAPAP